MKIIPLFPKLYYPQQLIKNKIIFYKELQLKR